jgi:F0F1-type ATP synthase assembly protein I
MHRNARRVVVLQVGVAVVIALLLNWRKGETAAVSALLGGAIGFVPAWIYAHKMSAVSGADPQNLLRAQYRAEFYKFAVTAVMFALVFILFREVSALSLFMTYFATLAVYWVALVMS